MLDFDRVKKLHETAVGNDKAEVSLLHNAVLERMNEYKKHSTASNKKDWDAAKQGLVEAVSRLWPKYFPEDSVSTDPQQFERQKDALTWLRLRGYKCSTGKFSNDWNGGQLNVVRGIVTLSSLLEYAATLDVDQKKIGNAEKRAERRDDQEHRLIKAKADREEMKAEDERRELDRKWMHIDRAEELIGLWVDVAFGSCVDRVNRALPSIIHACGGDMNRLAEVRDVIDRAHDDAGNDLANCGEISAYFEEQDDV